MKLLGIYLGRHDSNVTMVDDGEARYYKAERLFQHKHKRATIEWVKTLCTARKFIPDLVGFSDGNRNELGTCPTGELFSERKPLDIFPRAKTYCLDHHYSHVLSAWPVLNESPVEFGVTIDGRGDHALTCSVIKNPMVLHDASIEFSSSDHEYCFTFNKIGHLMMLSGGELDFAGKIMGAHAYGKIDDEFVGRYSTDHYSAHPLELLKVQYRNREVSDICNRKGEHFYDWLASIHKLLETYIEKMFRKYIPCDATVVYAGGAAQNAVYNERLSTLYKKLIIPPHCYDGGISLGCVKLLSMMTDEPLRIKDFPFSQDETDVGYASEETIRRVVDLLLQNKIVGWCQGKGEIGPRALGHRSILMNPGIPNGKANLNDRVKKREFWRPYAASIRRSSLATLTGRDSGYPFMLHALPVHEGQHELLKSVIHIDGTCRFQTVENEGALGAYYHVLDLFEDAGGCNALLNTSLNAGGKPIVSSKDDATRLYGSIDIDALCIGNTLMIK